MRRVKLDRIDRRILRDLQNDGRMTNVELARRAGISAPPCLRRVRALEEAGFIRGYHADVNPDALGFGVTVFAQVGLSSQAEADLKKFEELVNSWPLVRECNMLAGEYDFVLKIVAEDWDDYQRFLTTKLTAAPNVAHVKSALSIRTSKHNPGVPIDVDSPDIPEGTEDDEDEDFVEDEAETPARATRR
jgi:DNA-binding Lrp family transcriptional regulator